MGANSGGAATGAAVGTTMGGPGILAGGAAGANGSFGNGVGTDNMPWYVDPLGMSHKATPGEAPELSNIQSGTSVDDVRNAQAGVGNSLQSQQALLQALQGQGGLNQQNALAGQLAQANGIGTQNRAISGLENTAGMYSNIAQGRGPNPAMAMLNQQTGQNVANQAALMAGQRGAGANAGLLARQAAQQGGALQQQAVGQGATMQANQQLNALQGLSGTQQAIGGLGSTQAAAQQALANQVAGQQIGGTNAMAQANLSNQGQMQNALQGINTSNVASQGSVNAANAGLAQQTMANKAGIMGGLMNAGGAALGSAAGGMVPHMAQGGMPMQQQPVSQPVGPQSSFGQYLTGLQPEQPSTANFTPMEAEQPKEAKKAPSELGEIASIASLLAEGGLASKGGHVAAEKASQKAEKSGNSYDNDKVPAMLSEGEIVLPRSITQSSDPVAAAAEFVRKTLHERSQKQHFQDGGKVGDKEEKDDDTDEVVAAPVSAGPGVAAPPPTVTAPLDPASPASAAPSSAPPPAPVAGAPAVPQPAMQVPISGAATVPQPEPEQVAEAPKTPEQMAQEKTQKNLQLADDLRFNRIEPKTVGDLIGEKSTTGKIGTIFGLLLSGAGSGLSHQPNALLEMMNKQIERDVEAQKQNQANKQTWFKAGLEQLQTFADTNLTNAQAGKTAADTDFQRFKNAEAGVTNMEATNDAANNTTIGEMVKLQHVINAMPAGPQKDAYQQVYDQKAVPFFMNKIQQRNIETEQKKAAIKALNPGLVAQQGYAPGVNPKTGEASIGKDSSGVNEDKFNSMMIKGQRNYEVGGINKGDAIPKDVQTQARDEKAKLNLNRKNYADTAAAAAALNELKNAGQVPGVDSASNAVSALASIGGALFGGPAGAAVAGTGAKLATALPGETLKEYFERNRQIEIDALAERLGYNKSDAAKMKQINALMPSWADDDKSRKRSWELMNKHFKNNPEEETPVLNQFGLKYKAPTYAFPNNKIKSAPSGSKKKDETSAAAPEVKKEEPEEKESLFNQMFNPKKYRGK